MTNREMMIFLGDLEAANLENEIIEQNKTKIHDKAETIHNSYSIKGQKIVELKKQLVELYAAKDKDGYATVKAQEIDSKTIVDYDYGENRELVETTLAAWLTINTKRRQDIEALWDIETDVEWDLIDDKDIPAELKEDLLPITKPAEVIELDK